MYLSIANYFPYQNLGLLAGDVSLNPGPSGSNDRIKMAKINVRSIKPKTFPVTSMAVTETWLKHDKAQSSIADIPRDVYGGFQQLIKLFFMYR